MIKKINNPSQILKIMKFIEDQYLFSIIIENIHNQSLIIYSDEKNYIFYKDKENYPIWIWTRNNFNLNIIPELKKLINQYLTENNNKIICKPELYKLLVNNNIITSNNYYEMGFLKCEYLKKTKPCDGNLYIPNIYDIEILSQYYYESCQEIKEKSAITYIQAKDYINMIISENYFHSNTYNTIYAWKNNSNEIVSLGIYSGMEKYAKINNVFTNKENRKHGYASNLIYSITNEIINDEMIPLVYLNKKCNECYNLYKNIGYTEAGMLINTTCSKSKIKRKN